MEDEIIQKMYEDEDNIKTFNAAANDKKIEFEGGFNSRIDSSLADDSQFLKVPQKKEKRKFSAQMMEMLCLSSPKNKKKDKEAKDSRRNSANIQPPEGLSPSFRKPEEEKLGVITPRKLKPASSLQKLE